LKNKVDENIKADHFLTVIDAALVEDAFVKSDSKKFEVRHNMRGVRDTKISPITSLYSDVFNQNDNKGEFLKHIGLDSKKDL